jgi:O-antigen ligase
VKTSPLEKYKQRYHFSVNFYSLFLIATFIPDVLHINILAIKYSYWFIKVLLACLVISKDRRPLLNLGRLEIAYVLLVLLYAIIIFVDVFVAPYPGLAKSDTFFMSGLTDFAGFILGIIIAFSFRYDPAYHSERSFEFFWISLAIALVLSYFLAFENVDLDTSNVRFDANSTINSIMYGQTGCAMALISIFGFVNNKKRLYKALFFATFLLGLISISKAGSRSPVIVLAVVSIFYFIARVGVVKSLFIVLAFVTVLLVFINQILALMTSMGSTLATRLTSMVVENDSSGRDGIYANAWSLIKEYPLFGSFYLLQNGVGAGGYPHNFLLEIFMATGIVGGIPFVILLLVSVYRAFKLLKSRHESSWIVMLYLQVIVYGMFSTGLYTSQDFWVLLFFMISMHKTVLSKNFKGNRISMAINHPAPLLN